MSLNTVSPPPSATETTPQDSANRTGLQSVLTRSRVRKAIEKTSPEERKERNREYERNRAARRKSGLQAEGGFLNDHPNQPMGTTELSGTAGGYGANNHSPDPQVLQVSEDRIYHLVDVDSLSPNLISFLQKIFTAIMRDTVIQKNMEQKSISRFRIGRIVKIILRRNDLLREDAYIILVHNVMLAYRKSGCQVTTGVNRRVKDLTASLRRSCKSLDAWFKGVTEYADKQLAARGPHVEAHPEDGLPRSLNGAAYSKYLGRGIDPTRPTEAMRGSEGKVLMLIARHEAGISLWSEEDGPPDNDNPPGAARPTADDDGTDDVEEDDDLDGSVAGIDIREEEFA